MYRQAVSTGKTERSASQRSVVHLVSHFLLCFFVGFFFGLSRKSIRLCPVMSGTRLSTLYAWKVIDFNDTTEKRNCHHFSDPGSVFELAWAHQPIIKCLRCLSAFKTTRSHFSNIFYLFLEWNKTVFLIFSVPSWFISFEMAIWLNQVIKLKVKWKPIPSVLL